MKKYEKLKQKFRKALLNYQMIEKNDKIILAVSGGKDSLLMAKIFADFKKYIPIDFEIIAVHLKNELTEKEIREKTAEYLIEFFEKHNIPYLIKDLPTISASAPDKPVSCFWCSWLRRSKIFELAKEIKANKVAFGHHQDDIVETLMMNLVYHSKFATMPMRLALFGGELTLIRPMGYIREREIQNVINQIGLKPTTCLCPFAGNTKRQEIKTLLQELCQKYPDIKISLFNAAHKKRIEDIYLL